MYWEIIFIINKAKLLYQPKINQLPKKKITISPFPHSITVKKRLSKPLKIHQ